MAALERTGPLLGRILIAIIFIAAGYGKATGLAGTAGYIASKGLPFPEVLAAAAAALELGGGILLVVGWKARWAAAALFGFTLLTALIFHAFWAVPPEMVQNQTIHFMKNLAMAGGLLYVVVHGSGPLSVDSGK
ncbi:MAG: DoxX family protein [Rhodocyclales bacterium]|nr:DoxX family protein [Rhodocyclales bacterium]